MTRPSDQPLDPRTDRGRQTAQRLTDFLAQMRLRIAEREQASAAGRDAA